ncbi:SLAM family member 5-like [Pseudorasbora parva]|uniref:SLAM family member 5-like n=1 Tax=Pseudorasbora parva TaxID=51549 RepID=UPI00351F44D1
MSLLLLCLFRSVVLVLIHQKMFRVFVLFCLSCFRLIGVFGAETNEIHSVSVTEGDSVTLHNDVSIVHEDNNIDWKYGAEKYIIAEISRRFGFFLTYNGTDGRFRDRLKLDDQTGSLTITNIRTEHAGVYKVEMRGVKLSSKTFSVSVNDVFGAETNEIHSVPVIEGDSVTLHTDVTEILDDNNIHWKYGAEKSLIAEIVEKYRHFYTYNGTDGRFRDRLKLDHQTGSLTITNIRTEHAGVYKVEMTGAKLSSKTFRVSVNARLPVPVISRNCSSSSSSSSCSLVCSVLNVSHVTLSWFKGNSLLSSISVSDLSISLSLPLEVEYQDKNTYSCVLNNPISNQTRHPDITQLCHTSAETIGPSHPPPPLVSLIVLISAGSLVTVAGFVIFWICKKLRKTDQEGKSYNLTLSNK